MPNHHHSFMNLAKNAADLAGGLGLAAPGSHCADRDHWPSGFQHGVARPDENKVGPMSHHKRCLVHYIYMGDIAVGKGHQIHMIFFYEIDEPTLRVYRDAFRICLPCQFVGIETVVYKGYLRCGKCHDPIAGVLSEIDVEVVKIPAGSAHDDDIFSHFTTPIPLSIRLIADQPEARFPSKAFTVP
jgi:hypothetical protein